MLVIDDSKLKLLKMKEKMLELSAGNRDKTLEEYRNIALEIDNECYQTIVDKIKNTDYNHLSLEEQIKFYTEIVDDYNQLNELQCDYRNVFTKYSDGQELALSDLSNVFIEAIKNRISQIEGYLMNIKNLNSNKIELDNLNKELIDATKKKEQVAKAIADIRGKLKDDVANARGRIYGANGNLEVTNISLEFKKYGLDLEKLISRIDLLDRAYADAKKERDDNQETLDIALSIPNSDDMICASYMKQLLKSNYKFNLIELIKEIYSDNNDYYLFKDSLYKIEDLVKEIKNGLKELNIKYYINPFDYIKIKDYIAAFDKFNDYSIDIDKITNTMTYLSEMIENMEKKNNELQLSINKELVVLTENINTIYMNISKEEEHEDESKSDIFKLLHLEDAKDNQVIRVADIKSNFKISRVIEKTRGVINRVYGMFFLKNKNGGVSKAPELIIEKKQVLPSFENPVANYEKGNINIEFNEMEPFEEPQLFDDRRDNGIFEENESKKMMIDLSKKEPTNEFKEKIDMASNDVEGKNETLVMPELFWTPKEDDNTSIPRAVSFDEQLEALMGEPQHLRR